MRSIYLLILSFFGFSFYANAQFTETFNDGGFNVNPNWDGTENLFTVNADRVLQLNAVSGGTNLAYLSTECTLTENVTYEFYLKLLANPSNENFIRIYLSSNNQDLSEINNSGYYLQTGGQGNNVTVDFYQQNIGVNNLLLSTSLNGISKDIDGTFKVERISNCKWKFYYKPYNETDFIVLDSVTDNSITTNQYFGFLCEFTPNNAQNYFFDDISVSEQRETTYTTEKIDINKITTQANTVTISFNNNNIDPSILTNSSNYVFSPNINISTINLIEPHIVVLNTSNLEENTIYRLVVRNESTCSYNEQLNDTIIFAYTDMPQEADIIINEVMYYTDKEEYIECYNNTTKLFQLKDIVLVKENTITQLNEEVLSFENYNYLIEPNSYFVLTSNKDNLKGLFTNVIDELLIECPLPTLDDKEDIIGIRNSKTTTIDRLRYNEDFQLSIISSTKNVSLERINFDSPTQDKNNWHSAAKKAGYATPTQPNSHELYPIEYANVSIETEIFSPDQDGVDDLLILKYAFDNSGASATIKILNTEGRVVKEVITDEILEKEGFIKWDGTTDNGTKATVGIYFIIADITESNGKQTIHKKKCVLAARLN